MRRKTPLKYFVAQVSVSAGNTFVDGKGKLSRNETIIESATLINQLNLSKINHNRIQ